MNMEHGAAVAAQKVGRSTHRLYSTLLGPLEFAGENGMDLLCVGGEPECDALEQLE